MKVEKLIQVTGADFFTGVPDSLLKPLCNYLYNHYGTDPAHHIVAANEGNAVAIAAGYSFASGRTPVVYLQNSGEGNIVNPVASLLSDRVYAIPMIFIVGWRGEPGLKDEPQHKFQGEITLTLLETIGIDYYVIDSDTTDEDLEKAMDTFRERLSDGCSVAFVIRKNALEYDEKAVFRNTNTMVREEVIRHILKYSGPDPVISTTGKTSREVFELREAAGEGHSRDFLTVGSMGHSSSIALGVALNKPESRVWCIDGDGAALMHLGAMAVIGSYSPKNLVHVVINNCAHESVGGMPTAAKTADIAGIAKCCGYPFTCCVDSFESLDRALRRAVDAGELTLIEVKAAIGSRADLGRPTTTAIENKKRFVEYLGSLS